jgi:hypothetical protein
MSVLRSRKTLSTKYKNDAKRQFVRLSKVAICDAPMPPSAFFHQWAQMAV